MQHINRCMSKTYKELKQILKDEDVPLRSSLKTKRQMCDVLVYTGYFDQEQDVDDLGDAFANITINNKPQFGNLPSTMMKDVLQNFGPSELIHFCATNKYMKAICQDDSLWESLFKRNFGSREYKKENNMSWFQLYKDFVEYPYEIIDYMAEYPFDDIFPVVFKRGATKRETDSLLATRHNDKVRKVQIYKNKPFRGELYIPNISSYTNEWYGNLIFTKYNDVGKYMDSIGEESYRHYEASVAPGTFLVNK